MTMKPTTKPTSGELIIGTMTFQRMPLPCHQCSLPGTDQMMEDQRLPEAASTAPQRPPTSACDELEGRPNHHVSRLQTIAAVNAQHSTGMVATCASTRPEAIVAATAVPKNAPMRLVTAASITACRGVSTLVETTVAMELAVS